MIKTTYNCENSQTRFHNISLALLWTRHFTTLSLTTSKGKYYSIYLNEIQLKFNFNNLRVNKFNNNITNFSHILIILRRIWNFSCWLVLLMTISSPATLPATSPATPTINQCAVSLWIWILFKNSTDNF